MGGPRPFAVRFLPENRTYLAEGEVDLFLAAASCDILVEQPCGKKAVCAKCKVRYVEGAPPADEAEKRLLTREEIDGGWRLACRSAVVAAAVVEVPAVTRSVAGKSFGPEDLFAGGFDPVAPRGLGVALDVGSTSLAASLVDLADGSVLASASRLNPQVSFGADVISRIHYSQENEGGHRLLHDVLVRGIADLVRECCESSGLSPHAIVAYAAAGNPTMLHTLVGVEIVSFGQAPYVGLWTEARTFSAEDLGLPGSGASVWTFPMVRSHVGGDTVAALLALGIDRAEGWTLMVDLGTNSEVAIGKAGRLVCTSTAAGPAFEGANIHHGMRAAPGAIDAVSIRADGSVRAKTVANAPAVGICGSGLIDAAAELVRVGVVDLSGRMEGDSFRLGGTDERPVLFTAQDVRQLQLIKGSIRGGMEILRAHLGISWDDLAEVRVAGAFGNYVRKTSALAIGLVPPVDPERIVFVGDAAGVGARLALVDRRARARATAIASSAEYVELAGHPDYEESFVSSIPFPTIPGLDGRNSLTKGR